MDAKNIFLFLPGVTQSKNEDLKEMGDISSGMSSRVIQIYLKEILNCFLNKEYHVRSMAMGVIDIVLRQGLVHPVQIVPYLICLSTDLEKEVIFGKVLRILKSFFNLFFVIRLHKKQPSIYRILISNIKASST